jgi:hypothetical protein
MSGASVSDSDLVSQLFLYEAAEVDKDAGEGEQRCRVRAARVFDSALPG